MIEVDGSYSEGGGQILRTALAFSAITKKPCRVFNIRRGRDKPGLMPQHLLGIQALAKLTNGKIEGDTLNSQEIEFYPGEDYRNQVLINVPTAASITLVLQTLILPSLLAPSPIKIVFEGGATDTFFSPTIDHFQYVFLKVLEKMGGRVEMNILKKGYYPEGGAKVEVTVPTLNFSGGLKPLKLTETGALKKILAISGASESLRDKKVGERQLAGVREVLGKLKLPTEEKVQYYQTQCPGSQVCLLALFENTIIGTDDLGKLGKRAEDVGKEAAQELLREQKSQACLDKHLADQILPYLALSSGKSQIKVSEITSHCKTNIWTIEKFVKGKFKLKDNLISFPSTS